MLGFKLTIKTKLFGIVAQGMYESNGSTRIPNVLFDKINVLILFLLAEGTTTLRLIQQKKHVNFC